MSNWLLHEDQKEIFEIVFALVMNIIYLVLAALLLWIVDRAVLALDLAKGYGTLWLVTFAIAVLLARIQRLFKVNLYDHFDAFLVSNLLTSCLLQAGWAAFAALTIPDFVNGASRGTLVLLYVLGGLSCLIAFYVVSSFFQGHFYRLISFPLTLVSFIVFSLWPVSGRALYGWFFELF